jgi:hypothetical protein
MDNLINNELELRKWALEISLKHGNALFPIGDYEWKKPSMIMEDARRIIELVTKKWNETIIDPEWSHSDTNEDIEADEKGIVEEYMPTEVQFGKYKQIETTPEIVLENGSVEKPIATLEDGHGGVCHIIEDDNCYVILLRKSDGNYADYPYIFGEAFDVLKTLPPPDQELRTWLQGKL